MDQQQRINRKASAEAVAVGLGWFSIGLGVAELLFAGPLCRALGMKGHEGLVRTYGLREIATGVGILTAEDKAPWIWGRVAGDALDIATLAAATPGSGEKANMAIAYGAVAGATMLDIGTARALTRVERKLGPVRDYSDRSGFPMGIEAARGAARKDFNAPRDMVTPEALRPTMH
jgi:hypothetical protein